MQSQFYSKVNFILFLYRSSRLNSEHSHTILNIFSCFFLYWTFIGIANLFFSPKQMILVATTKLICFSKTLILHFPIPLRWKFIPLAYAYCILLTHKWTVLLWAGGLMKSLSTSSMPSTEIEATSYNSDPRWTCFLYLLINKCITISVHTKIAFTGKHHSESLGLKRFTRDVKIHLPK